MNTFNTCVNSFRSKITKNLLDYMDDTFDRDFVEFNVDVSRVESDLQAYIDKNFMAWQESMMDTGQWKDHSGTKDLGAHDKSDPPDLTNKNYFGYPRQANLEEWKDIVLYN